MRVPYVAKTLSGAQERVRRLERQLDEKTAIVSRYERDRVLLAKLAAEKPLFDDPFRKAEAEVIRDRILKAKKGCPGPEEDQ